MGVLWRRYVMLGVEGSIFNRSVIWLYIIKVIKIMLTFIAVTFFHSFSFEILSIRKARMVSINY